MLEKLNLTVQTKPKGLLTREAGKRDEKVGRPKEEPWGQVQDEWGGRR